MEFELSIEELEEVTPKHPVTPEGGFCSAKPFRACLPIGV